MVQRSGVLIETYWNVKNLCIALLCSASCGINRNILECKASYHMDSHVADTSINRNILECKGEYVRLACQRHLVLIETYWNVKKYTQTADLGYIPY